MTTTDATSTTHAWVEVTDREALRELVGEPAPAARDKVRHAPQDETVEELDEYYGPAYAEGLYR